MVIWVVQYQYRTIPYRSVPHRTAPYRTYLPMCIIIFYLRFAFSIICDLVIVFGVVAGILFWSWVKLFRIIAS